MTVSSPPSSKTLALVFTDLVDSLHLKLKLGEDEAAQVLQKHRESVRLLLRQGKGREVDCAGDGFFLTFDTPSAAVTFGLRALKIHAEDPSLPLLRIGVHLGEVVESGGGTEATKVEGIAVDLACRVQGLADPGQIIMTAAVFDSVRWRLNLSEFPWPVRWMAHGSYVFKGLEDHRVDIGEVGFEGRSPLSPPRGSDKARRHVAAGDEITLGWRPAKDEEIPSRPDWLLKDKLGEGSFGEVWLATHRRTSEKRAFKFCFDAERVRQLKREVALCRLLREALGDRGDIARIYDWQLQQAPFFIESEYTEGGNLIEWAKTKGGIEALPLAGRIEIVARVAEALAAAHNVGILHKDIKPANILMTSEGKPRLADFGIGSVTSAEVLKGKDVSATMAGALASSDHSTGWGSMAYMAPELLEGKPATVLSDIYSLGILLYQVVTGDLRKALGPGWERDVLDPVLRAVIADCVDRDSSKRLANASEVIRRLGALDSDRRLHAERETAVERDRVEGERAKKRRERLRLLAIAAGILLLALAIIGVEAYRHAREVDRLNLDARRTNDALRENDRTNRERVTRFLQKFDRQKVRAVLEKYDTGEAAYRSEEFADLREIGRYFDRLGYLINERLVPFEQVYASVRFPDEFWAATEDLRNQFLKVNWNGPGKPVPEFWKNFAELRDRYEARRAAERK